MSETSALPSFSFRISSMLGARICTTASASAIRAAAEPSTRAPAARYSSSLAKAAAPAPDSTDTSTFFAERRFTESGTIATRRSPMPVSFRTAILMEFERHVSYASPPGQGRSAALPKVD